MKRSALQYLVAVAMVLSACKTGVTKNMRPEILLPPNVSVVDTDPNGYWVRFSINEPYPAATTLAFVGQHLRSNWAAVPAETRIPDLDAWSEYIDTTGPAARRALRWHGQGLNGKGDMLDYVITYYLDDAGRASVANKKGEGLVGFVDAARLREIKKAIPEEYRK